MIVVAVLAQLAALQAGPDSVYSSSAVAELVRRATERNREVTVALRPYRANVESEFAWAVQDTIGRERVFAAQQHYSSIRWDSAGFDVRVLSLRPAIKMPSSNGMWPG